QRRLSVFFQWKNSKQQVLRASCAERPLKSSPSSAARTSRLPGGGRRLCRACLLFGGKAGGPGARGLVPAAGGCVSTRCRAGIGTFSGRAALDHPVPGGGYGV